VPSGIPSRPTAAYVKNSARPSLEALGLSKNPFREATDDFFSEGDRGRRLEELRHPARWSRRLLVVTGERGVGKSALYRALSNSLDPGVKAARINANLTSDTREVLAGIIQGFGMAAPANADPRLLIDLIALHVQEQGDAHRYCLVLIDDAHLLELRALEQLLKLVDAGAEEGLRMVFFAEAYFVQSLDTASKRTDQTQNWHEIRLTPFTNDESRRYVALRLAQAGLHDRSAFTQNELSVIVGGSSGMPGRIDELASAILTGDLTISEDRNWLPRTHRALVVLVLIGAGLGWLIFNGYPKPAAEPREQPTDARVEPGPPPVSGTASLAIPTPQIAAESVAPPVTRTLPEAPPPMEPAAEAAVAAAAPAVPEQKRIDPAPAMPQKLALEAPPKEPPPKVAEPQPKRVPDAVQQVAGSKPRSSPPSPAVGKPRSAQWIRDQPGKYFTLQLFATTSRDKRDQFLRQQDHKEQFAMFETKRDGVPWFAVAYGSYATQAEARSAAASLPASVGRVEPWVRTFASVQATLD